MYFKYIFALTKGTMLKVVVVYGGVSVMHQRAQIRQGCSVMVGTPGRALQMIREQTVCKKILIMNANIQSLVFARKKISASKIL